MCSLRLYVSSLFHDTIFSKCFCRVLAVFSASFSQYVLRCGKEPECSVQSHQTLRIVMHRARIVLHRAVLFFCRRPVSDDDVKNDDDAMAT